MRLWLWGLAGAALVASIVGANSLWNWSEHRSAIPKQLLATHMPVKLADDFIVMNYDSSFLPSIDGGLEVTFWRISLGSADRKTVAEYCDKRSIWSAPVDANVTDNVLNHSVYSGARFSPCEVSVTRRREDTGYGTIITYDGKYLLMERVRAWP